VFVEIRAQDGSAWIAAAQEALSRGDLFAARHGVDQAIRAAAAAQLP
jgi:hypothetical protein